MKPGRKVEVNDANSSFFGDIAWRVFAGCVTRRRCAIISVMDGHDRGRLVYSTGRGRLCTGCGWPEADCRCSASLSAGNEAIPQKITARLRIEIKGRAGKTMTVVDGLPRNSAFLKALAAELKKACGTGGTAGDGSVELQGDQRERLRQLLAAKGLGVKG